VSMADHRGFGSGVKLGIIAARASILLELPQAEAVGSQ